MPRGFGEVDGPHGLSTLSTFEPDLCEGCWRGIRNSHVFWGIAMEPTVGREFPDPMTAMIYFHFISGFLPFTVIWVANEMMIIQLIPVVINSLSKSALWFWTFQNSWDVDRFINSFPTFCQGKAATPRASQPFLSFFPLKMGPPKSTITKSPSHLLLPTCMSLFNSSFSTIQLFT